jgi:hypothetical protein
MTSTTEKLLAVTLLGITEGLSQIFGPRALKRKKWDIVCRDHITAMCWKDKRGRYTLIPRGFFCMNRGKL